MLQKPQVATMNIDDPLPQFHGQLDAMLFQAEAEVRWLDHCEASLVRYTPPPILERTEHAEPAEI